MEAWGRLSRVWWKALPPDPLSSDTGSDCFRRAACAIRSGGSVARLPGHRAEHGRPRPEVSVSHGTPRKLQSFRRVPASSGEFRPVPPSSVEPVAFAHLWICAELQGSSPSKALRRLLVEGLSSSKALRRILVKGLPPNGALGPGRSPVGWKHPPDTVGKCFLRTLRKFRQASGGSGISGGSIHQTSGSRPIGWKHPPDTRFAAHSVVCSSTRPQRAPGFAPGFWWMLPPEMPLPPEACQNFRSVRRKHLPTVSGGSCEFRELPPKSAKSKVEGCQGNPTELAGTQRN